MSHLCKPKTFVASKEYFFRFPDGLYKALRCRGSQAARHKADDSRRSGQ